MSSQNWLSLLPDALLLLSLPVMFLVNRFREAKTAKTFYTLQRTGNKEKTSAKTPRISHDAAK